MRNPNSWCTECSVGIYRRPNEIQKYRHTVYRCAQCRKPKLKTCVMCSKEFIPSSRAATKFCSRACANRGRTGIKYRLGFHNLTQARLHLLRERFDFHICMVENCNYSTCFDLHRLKPGREGGEYVIGNMFAICPNHHAEVSRGLINLEYIDDATLRIGKPMTG